MRVEEGEDNDSTYNSLLTPKLTDKRMQTQHYKKTGTELESEELKFGDNESQSGSQFTNSNFDQRMLDPSREKRGES